MRSFQKSLPWMALAAATAVGCSPIDGHFTSEEWELIESLASVDPMPGDPTNAFADDEDAALLGQRLFFDPRFATAIKVDFAHPEAPGMKGEAGRVSCATCHDPCHGFADGRPWPTSLGVNWTPRNTTSLLDLGYLAWFFWDGKADAAWQGVAMATEVGAAQNANRLHVAHFLYENYRTQYDAVFSPETLPASLPSWPTDGKPMPKAAQDPMNVNWEMLTASQREDANRIFANYSKAIAAYLQRLETGESPFDRYASGDHDAIDEAAKRGLALFIGKAGCIECHSGPRFTDGKFHNIGVAQGGPPESHPDVGRGTLDDLKGGADKYKDKGNPDNAFASFGPFSDGSPRHSPDDLEIRPEDLGAFRTPSLRNIAQTGPYMHNGSLATLETVVSFYAWGGDPFGYPGTQESFVAEGIDLSEQEQADLVAFLGTLDGELPPDSLLKAPDEQGNACPCPDEQGDACP